MISTSQESSVFQATRRLIEPRSSQTLYSQKILAQSDGVAQGFAAEVVDSATKGIKALSGQPAEAPRMAAMVDLQEAARYQQRAALQNQLRQKMPGQGLRVQVASAQPQVIAQSIPLAVTRSAQDFASQQMLVGRQGLQNQYSMRIKPGEAVPSPLLHPEPTGVNENQLQLVRQRIQQNGPTVQQLYKKQQENSHENILGQAARHFQNVPAALIQPMDMRASLNVLEGLSDSINVKQQGQKRNCFLEAQNDAPHMAAFDPPGQVEVVDLHDFRPVRPQSSVQPAETFLNSGGAFASHFGPRKSKEENAIKRSVLLSKMRDESIFMPKLKFSVNSSKASIVSDFASNAVDFRQINQRVFQQNFLEVKAGQLATQGAGKTKRDGFRIEIPNQQVLNKSDLDTKQQQALEDGTKHQTTRDKAEQHLFDSQIDYMSVSRDGQLNLKNRIYAPGTQSYNQFRQSNRLLELDEKGIEQFAMSLLGRDIRQ